MTDVNTAFANEREAMVGRIERLRTEEGAAEYIAQQTANFDARVVAGELVKIGEGRYQSTQGWDRGEIWTVQAVNGENLVLPEHGLDLNEAGRARLYLGGPRPAWHGLGTWIPGGVEDVEEVIKLGALDVPAVTIPAPAYSVPGLKGTFTPEGLFHVVNGNTGAYWGSVGKIHRNLPIRDSFAFLQHLQDREEVTWESAGLMGEGRRVFISCKVPGGITIDRGGLDETTDLFLVVQDARDGSASYCAMCTPWRPLCQNTNRFALRDAVSVVKLRHTSGLPDRIAQARETLGMTVRYAAEYGTEETVLARTAAKLADFEALMAELSELDNPKSASGRVFGARDRDAEATANRTRLGNDRRETDLLERWAEETGRVGETLYAAEQAYTGHLDWGQVRKGTSAAARWNARIEASLSGDDDNRKSRAHALLMARTA